MTGYDVKITGASKEFTAREKIMLKDTSNAIQIDECLKKSGGKFKIVPASYAILEIHNERSKQEKDYNKIVVIDNDGVKYVTGSASFVESFVAIFDELKNETEPYEVEVYTIPSKNFTGNFITCSLV